MTPAPAYTTLPAAVAVTGSPRLPAISIPLCTLEAKVLTTFPRDGHCHRDTGRLGSTDLAEDAFLEDCVFLATFFATLVAGAEDEVDFPEVVFDLLAELWGFDEAVRVVVDFPAPGVLDDLFEATAAGFDV